MCRFGIRNELLDGGLVADVEAGAARADTDLRGDAGRLLGIDIGDDDMPSTLSTRRLGQRLPDARSCTSDDNDPITKFHAADPRESTHPRRTRG